MRRIAIGLSLIGALAAAGALAQERGSSGGGFPGRPGAPGMGPLSPADRAAFTDARIAALHAGLKLDADQEKLWPSVEEAIRGLAKQRLEARDAQRERFAALREGGRPDIAASLRFMADRQAASAGALGRLADATAPLYAALDEGQKRRMELLARPLLRVAGPEARWPMRRGRLGEDGPDFGGAGRPAFR